MSRRLSDLEPETGSRAVRLISVCRERGFFITLVHTLRTYEEQALIYARGRSRPGPIVTYAPPGYSWHNFGRAFDIAFRLHETSKDISWNGPWEVVGVLGERMSLVWGGRWKHPDRPHFEYHPNLTLAQARERNK